MKSLFTRCAVIAALVCCVGSPARAKESKSGSSKTFEYVIRSPLDTTKNISTYIRDAENSALYFYLKNDQVQVNFSTISSGNNAYGSMRPGTPMDVMPTSKDGFVDCLDWTEMILLPSSDLTATNLKVWDWAKAGRHLSLPAISAIHDKYIIASGEWESSDSIHATAIYTLLEDQPIMRIELTLSNSGKESFTGAMGYVLDHDLGDQFCYLPGIGWGKNNSLDAVKTGWTSNYVYEGTDVIRPVSVPAHGVAWDSTKTNPYAILYPGYIMGVWFSVDIPAKGSQKITYYHIVSEPSRQEGVNTYTPIEDLANKVLNDTFESEYIPVVSGVVLEKDGTTPISNAELICRDIESHSVATAKTNANGYYSMHVPIGTYTTTVSRISYYKESRSIEINESKDYTLDFVMEAVSTTNASYGETMNGSLANGGDGDLTLQNNKIALTLADQFVDNQMQSTKGKPIDFGFSNQLDAFDWINMPIVTYEKVLTENAWNQHCVKFDTLYIQEISDLSTKVIAEGNCDTIPLKVKSVYEIRPNETWVSVSSTFINPTDTAITVYLSDAMDLDESGEKAFYPSSDGLVTITDNNVTIEFAPVQAWMGQYGTATNQSFGIVYSGSFAEGMSLYGCQRWMVARKQVTIPAKGTYVLDRKIVAVETREGEDRADAFLNYYNQYLGSNLKMGATFEVEKNRLSAGEKFKVLYTVSNKSDSETYQNIQAEITLPANLSVSNAVMAISSLKPGETNTLSWDVTANEGGGNRVIRGTVFVGEELLNNSRAQVFISGKGWYAADNHTHSKHSDGAGTIAENLTAARNKGLSFVSATDHNKISQANDLISFNSVNDDIIGILGNEVSISRVGHIVALFTDEVIPYTNIDSDEKAQGVVDAIHRSNQGKGLAFIAHPYYPGLEWKYPSTRGMRGYEVWNGFYKPKHSVNSRAFKLWDDRIIQDGQAYLGIANSDGHNSGKISDPHVRVLCEEFNVEEYRKSINSGHFYGTDGPDIRFKIGEQMMGDTLLVRDGGEAVLLDIQAMNSKGVDSIRVIKNGVRIIAEKVTSTDNIVKQYQENAKPGDFFRVEVDGKDATFAFSNPIFVRQGASTIELQTKQRCYTVSFNVQSQSLEIRCNENQMSQISVFTTTGQIIKTVRIPDTNKYSLPLPGINKGMYLVGINGVFHKFLVK